MRLITFIFLFFLIIPPNLPLKKGGTTRIHNGNQIRVKSLFLKEGFREILSDNTDKSLPPHHQSAPLPAHYQTSALLAQAEPKLHLEFDLPLILQAKSADYHRTKAYIQALTPALSQREREHHLI